MNMTQQVSGWIALIGIWRRRSRNRQELAAMSNRELQDIGITAWEARCEANKPISVAESSWRRHKLLNTRLLWLEQGEVTACEPLSRR